MVALNFFDVKFFLNKLSFLTKKIIKNFIFQTVLKVMKFYYCLNLKAFLLKHSSTLHKTFETIKVLKFFY